MTFLLALLAWFGLSDLKLQQQPQTNASVTTGTTGSGGQAIELPPDKTAQ